MIQNLTTVVALSSLLILLYGVLQLINWPSPQECQMTYMYQYPQYTRIPIPQDVDHPKYQLYTYSEGSTVPLPVASTGRPHFNGAPVLFVHGNAGSHRQMRSLASVALRKAIDLKNTRQQPHLDYFAVDYSEELSALFGGYLQPQSDYLTHAIHAISGLYAPEHIRRTGLIIVAHSMGGKIAQAALQHRNVSALVHTVLMLATPVDRPVLDVDFFTSAFYRQIDTYWEQHRLEKWLATNETVLYGADDDNNYKRAPAIETERTTTTPVVQVPSALLDDVLLITIGGGVRDRLVPAGLTASRFSDVHVMSTSIPSVWLSTDHLCSVWCLQQVLVINRFLYEISSSDPGANKASRLLAARRHFEQQQPTKQASVVAQNVAAVQLFGGRSFVDATDEAEWQEDSRRQFTEHFPRGFGQRRTQMLRLHADDQYRFADLQLVNASVDEANGWLFGCAALETTGEARYCTLAERLDQTMVVVRRLPTRGAGTRRVVELDLHSLRRTHPKWTHVLVRTEPSLIAFHLTVDIHADRRDVHIQMPKWYSFGWTAALHETDGRESTVRLHIAGLTETYQSLQIEVTSRSTCTAPQRNIVARVCVPWSRAGFERFHYFGAAKVDDELFHLDVPVDRPHGYNTTKNPVRVQFYIDAPAGCPVTIRVRNSFARTAANVVLLFGHWLPAHLCIVLLLVLKQQVTITPKSQPFKCARFMPSLLRSSSFFIITASRLFVKMIEWTKAMPPLDEYEHSMVVSVLMHGTAVALLLLVGGVSLTTTVRAGAVLWRRICMAKWLCGCGIGDGCDVVVGAGTVWIALRNVPLAMGTIMLGLVLSTCGGLALVLACVFYLLILIDMQKNYLLALEEASTATTTTTATGSSALETATASIPIDEALTNKAACTTADAVDKATDESSISTSTDPAEIIDADEALEAIAPRATEENTVASATETTAALEDLKDDEEHISDAELNRLIRETLEQRKNASPAPGSTDEQQRRAAYEAMDVRQNTVNFHSALFLGLLLLTLLNVPSILAWSTNIPYSYSLDTDPSFIPAVVTILALVVMWQLNAPRQISGYSSIGTLLYLMAALCMLYAQDSVYRLNAFISATFVCLAVHQWLTPLMAVQTPEYETANGSRSNKKPMTPEEIDAMLEKIMEAERLDREQLKAAAQASGESVPDENDEEEDDAELVDLGYAEGETLR